MTKAMFRNYVDRWGLLAHRSWSDSAHSATRMRLLEHKVALVTGSSRGIGAAIAEVFAEHGAAVALQGRDLAALNTVKGRIDGRCMIVTAELTHYDDVQRMRQEIETHLGPVDVLVTNAGGTISPPGPLEEVSEASWRASVDDNLLSTFLTLKAFIPDMKRRRTGAIVTMSSAAARRPDPKSPVAYAAAKAGVQILTQDLAAQLGPFGVRVNCLAPETILTEKNETWIPASTRQALIEEHPIRRLGTPRDVAQAAVFLASDQASWISGVILDVAGGSVLK